MDVQEVLDHDNKLKLSELLLALAEALMPAGEPRRAVEDPLEKAFQIAEELSAPDILTRAFALAFDELTRALEGTGIVPHPNLRLWAERADRHVKPGTADRVNADLIHVQVLVAEGRWREANARAINALEVARVSKDPVAILRTATALRAQLPVWLIEQCISLADETAPLRAPRNARLYVSYVSSLVLLYLASRDTTKSDAFGKELEAFQGASHDPFATLWLLECEAQLATVAGRLEPAVEAVGRLVDRSSELGSPERGRFLGAFATCAPLIYLGRAQEFLHSTADSLTQAEREAPLVWSRTILCLAHLNRVEEAEQSLNAYIKKYNVFDGDTPALLMSDLLESAVLMKYESLSRRLADILVARNSWWYPAIGRSAV